MVDRTVNALKCTALVSRITQQRIDSHGEYQVYMVLQNWDFTPLGNPRPPRLYLSLRISRTKTIHRPSLENTYILLLTESSLGNSLKPLSQNIYVL